MNNNTCTKCGISPTKALGLCGKHYVQSWRQKQEDMGLAGLVRAIDMMNLPEDVIPVQKSEPPYIPSGHYGFMGVILCDTSSDRVQCHLCGLWFKSIGGRHILLKHDMTHREYKKRFGLYMKEPLMSPGTMGRVKAKRATWRGHVINDKDRVKANRVGKNGMSTTQFKNKFGTCEAQLKFRVDEHIKKYGKFPTYRTDSNLEAVLRYRFGSIQAARNYYKYPIEIRI